jgi:hypothetical protein
MTPIPSQRAEKHYAVSSGGDFLDLFEDDIAKLGADGFAEWLLGSFGGPKPSQRPGWFHTDSELLFGQLFRQAARQFTEETTEAAELGIAKALEGFDPANGTLFGLLELTGVVEALNAKHLLPKVAKILHYWFDPETSTARRRLDVRRDVLAFRETLECVFRLYPRSIGNLRKNSEPFAHASDWARQILRDHPHWLDRALVPCYAPLYMLSLGTASDPAERSRIRRTVESGWRTADDPFPELFVFESVAMPGAFFPYNVDRLLAMGENFLEEPSLKFQFHSGHDRFEPSDGSATAGFTSTSESSEYFNDYPTSIAA